MDNNGIILNTIVKKKQVNYVTAIGLKSTNTQFIKEHSTI